MVGVDLFWSCADYYTYSHQSQLIPASCALTLTQASSVACPSVWMLAPHRNIMGECLPANSFISSAPWKLTLLSSIVLLPEGPRKGSKLYFPLKCVSFSSRLCFLPSPDWGTGWEDTEMVISVRICLSPILRTAPETATKIQSTEFEYQLQCEVIMWFKKNSSVSLYFRHLDNADSSFRQGRNHGASLSFVMKVKREPAEMDVQHSGLWDPPISLSMLPIAVSPSPDRLLTRKDKTIILSYFFTLL